MNRKLWMTPIIATCLFAVLSASAHAEGKPAAGEIAGLKIPDGVAAISDIPYRPGDSKKWRLDLAMPAERGDAPRPAIVFVHGGGWRGGSKDKALFLGQALEYAAKGYVCVSVGYRLIDEAPMPACISDVKCAVRWLRAHAKDYNLDPGRIGAYGNSAGAHLASMLGVCPSSAGLEGDGPWQEYSSMVNAVVSSATPASFTTFKRRRPGNSDARRTSAWAGLTVEAQKQASPITYVSAGAPPFLLMHDVSDKTVPVQQSDDFVAALKKAGAKDVTYMRLDKGYGHGVFTKGGQETRQAMEAFFARTLKKK